MSDLEGAAGAEDRQPAGCRLGTAACRRLAAAVLLVALIAILLADAEWGLHRRLIHFVDSLPDSIYSLADFFRTRSLSACATYVCIHASAAVLCLPLTPIEIFTGYCFGWRLGVLIDLFGRTLGAVTSFSIARAVARCGVDGGCITGQGALRAVGKATEQHGIRFLALFSLAYIPVAVKNYGLGFVKEVPLHKFVAAVILAEVPFAAVWAFIGSQSAKSLAGASDSPGSTAAASAFAEIPLLILGIVSITLVLRIVHSSVQTKLDNMQEPLLGECAKGPPEDMGSLARL